MPYQTRQALRTPVSRRDAEFYLRLSHFRIIRRDADGTRHRQFQSASQRKAIDGSDCGLVQCLQPAKDSLPAQCKRLRFQCGGHGQFLYICSGDECFFTRARND